MIPTLRLMSVALLLTACDAHFVAAQSEITPNTQWQLWKINVDGTGLKPLVRTPGYNCGSPKWSPDGTLIAFDTRRTSEALTDSQIAVVNADGTDLRSLGPGGMPTWSPDGTQVVFHTYAGSVTVPTWMSGRVAPPRIIVMNAGGSGRETILDHFGSPRWMPHGNRIAVIGANGGLGIFDLATGQENTVFSWAMPLYPGFGISHDGRRVCYGLYSGGLYLASLDDQFKQPTPRMPAQSGNCYHASWSPDDKRVVFAWKPNTPSSLVTRGLINDYSTTDARRLSQANLHQLMLLEADSDAVPVLLPGQNSKQNKTNPDWSPDGKTIVFASDVP